MMKRLEARETRAESEWARKEAGLELKARKVETKNMEAKTILLKTMGDCGLAPDEVKAVLKHVLRS